MTIKDAIKIVTLLHNAYPQDKRATADDLAQRAEAYHVAFADYDLETVQKAATYCIKTSKWHPTTKELIDAATRVRLSEAVKVTPIQTDTADDAEIEQYLDAFVEWIGFGCEPDDTKELPRGVLPYEQ